ncbi:MAG TPA: hypothetical protein VMB05_06665 [Solirubrobacteraceae bacterium]|nr:hypothetical protein [Solirubrobacteraceae bacterium]
MPTALADPPAPNVEQQAPGLPDGPAQPGELLAPSPARNCAKCGAALVSGQDWCLQCGTGSPDSLRARTPAWRSAAVIFTALAILVLGAGGAAFAALSKGGHETPPVKTVAQVAPPAAPTPTTPTPPATGTTTPNVGVPTTIKPSTRPPKIPLATTPTPVPTPTPSIPSVTPTPSNSGGSTPTHKSKSGNPNAPVGEANAEALLLDTNAASTYNPYNYSAANFGDPSLAIDGDSSTGWTAQVEPSVAPKMAEGLLIDLNTPRKIAAVGLTTTTPGMTVQVYGADGEAPPASITDPAWVALTPAIDAPKHKTKIKLGHGSAAAQAAAKKPYRFIVLWISQAPASAVGTAEAPGHVSVNELELFPKKAK